MWAYSSNDRSLKFPKRPRHRMMPCWSMKSPRILISWFYFPRSISFSVSACDVSCDWRLMLKSALLPSIWLNDWSFFLTFEFLLLLWGACSKIVGSDWSMRVSESVFSNWNGVSCWLFLRVSHDTSQVWVVRSCKKFLSGLFLLIQVGPSCLYTRHLRVYPVLPRLSNCVEYGVD